MHVSSIPTGRDRGCPFDFKVAGQRRPDATVLEISAAAVPEIGSGRAAGSKSRLSEEQIIGILRKQEAGRPTAEVCRKPRVSGATFCKW